MRHFQHAMKCILKIRKVTGTFKCGELGEILFLQIQHLSMSNKRKHKYEKYCFIFLNIG